MFPSERVLHDVCEKFAGVYKVVHLLFNIYPAQYKMVDIL